MILQFHDTQKIELGSQLISEKNVFKIGAEFTVIMGKFSSKKIKKWVKYMHMNVRYRLTVITYIF